MERPHLFLYPLLLFFFWACGQRPHPCTAYGSLPLKDSLSQALAELRSDSQFVLLQVTDSSAASMRFIRQLDSTACLRYALGNAFAAHYRVNIANVPRRSPLQIYQEFAAEHALKPPFLLLLGRSDTVFAFTEVYAEEWRADTLSAPDSAIAFMQREQQNPNLRDDYTFLQAKEKEKLLTPKYYAWIRSLSVSGSLSETRDKKTLLRIEIHNPERFRIVAPGTDQRSYLAPLRTEWDSDTLVFPPLQWLSEAQSFRDAFLQKNYMAYTDSLIAAEVLLQYSLAQLPAGIGGHVILSVYVPPRKVAVNSVDLPFQLQLPALPAATVPLTKTSE